MNHESYQKEIEARSQENKMFLKGLQLDNVAAPSIAGITHKKPKESRKRKTRETVPPPAAPRTRSRARLERNEDEIEEPPQKKVIVRRIIENTFGHIPGIPVGTVFATRNECFLAGVHRQTVAGIHGRETTGCYSIVLSGGYEDDVDGGDTFTYTGSGGRNLTGTRANPKNLRTAPQTKDQVLTKSNKALYLNRFNRLPVRVVRGCELRSKYAPEDGFRYDGLYTVEKVWPAKGKAGFLVYKYRLKRIKDQDPAPWA